MSDASGHSHNLLIPCRTCPSWPNGSSLGPHALNGYGSMNSAQMNTIYGTRDPAHVENNLPKYEAPIFTGSRPVEHARHDPTDLHWARTRWMVMGQWIQPKWIPYRARVTQHVWRTSYQNMKHQSSLCRRVITGGSEKAARVSRRMDCWIGKIEY